MKVDLLEFLPKEEEKAISRADLCALTNLPDRTVREYIENLRRNGYVVQTAAKGYWLDESEGGWKKLIDSLESRGFSLLKTASMLRKMKTENQIKMEG